MGIYVMVQGLITILCAIHIYRSGAPKYWLAVIFMFPLAGVVAYYMMEVMHPAEITRTVHRVQKKFDPGMGFRARLNEVERCGSVQNKMSLADECINLGQYDEALRLYSGLYQGQFSQDQAVQYGLGRAQFFAGKYAEAAQTLSPLVTADPTYRLGSAALVHACALGKAGQHEQAMARFEHVVASYPNGETRTAYIEYLTENGKHQAAQKVLADMQNDFKLMAPAHKRNMRPWLKQAQDLLDESTQQTKVAA